MEQAKKKRGGKRQGAGNKAKDGANSENSYQTAVMIFNRQRKAFRALGGSYWLRGQIDKETQEGNAELKGRSGEAA